MCVFHTCGNERAAGRGCACSTPVNSRPRQTLRVTSESSWCMSSPKSSPCRYCTMKLWCAEKPASLCLGKRRRASGRMTRDCRSSTRGRMPMLLTITPYAFIELGRVTGRPEAS